MHSYFVHCSIIDHKVIQFLYMVEGRFRGHVSKLEGRREKEGGRENVERRKKKRMERRMKRGNEEGERKR